MSEQHQNLENRRVMHRLWSVKQTFSQCTARICYIALRSALLLRALTFRIAPASMSDEFYSRESIEGTWHITQQTRPSSENYSSFQGCPRTVGRSG